MKFESRDLNQETREQLDGSFVELSDGWVHYELNTPEKSKNQGKKNIVVLVHGFSTPMFVWDKIVPALNEEGYITLRFDLYGRGYSDRPDLDYGEDIYDKQVKEMIEEFVDNGDKVHLVGLSMGGEVATIFTARHPDRVKTLTLVDPAGLPSNLKTPPNFIFKIPGVSLLINKIVIKNLDKNFYKPEKFPEYEALFTDQMQFKGFRKAIKRSLMNMDMEAAEEEYEQAGKVKIPKLLFWGEEDETIPYSTHEKVLEKMSEIKFVSVPDCGHMPQYEQIEVFLKNFVPFLNENSA